MWKYNIRARLGLSKDVQWTILNISGAAVYPNTNGPAAEDGAANLSAPWAAKTPSPWPNDPAFSLAELVSWKENIAHVINLT
jgi:hypothetical protein